MKYIMSRVELVILTMLKKKIIWNGFQAQNIHKFGINILLWENSLVYMEQYLSPTIICMEIKFKDN